MEIGAISAWVFGGISLIAIGIAIGRLWQRRSAAASKSERTWLSRLPGGWVIGFFGGVLVVAAVGGYYVNRDGAATIGFAVIGAALVVVGAMSGRLAPWNAEDWAHWCGDPHRRIPNSKRSGHKGECGH